MKYTSKSKNSLRIYALPEFARGLYNSGEMTAAAIFNNRVQAATPGAMRQNSSLFLGSFEWKPHIGQHSG